MQQLQPAQAEFYTTTGVLQHDHQQIFTPGMYVQYLVRLSEFSNKAINAHGVTTSSEIHTLKTSNLFHAQSTRVVTRKYILGFNNRGLEIQRRGRSQVPIQEKKKKKKPWKKEKKGHGLITKMVEYIESIRVWKENTAKSEGEKVATAGGVSTLTPRTDRSSTDSLIATV